MNYLELRTGYKYRQGYEIDGKTIILELVKRVDFWEFSKLQVHVDLITSEELKLMLSNIIMWAFKSNHNILSPMSFDFGDKDAGLVKKLGDCGLSYTMGYVYFGDMAFNVLKDIKVKKYLEGGFTYGLCSKD